MVNHLGTETSAATARAAEAGLSAVFRDLFAREVIDALPARPVLPSPSPGRERFLSIAEADRLLAAAIADDEKNECPLMGPLLAVLIGTGCRISEALSLVWGPDGVDLDAKNPTITIRRESTKTNAGARRVGIEAEYAVILSAHRRATAAISGATVFADRQSLPLKRDGGVRSGLRRITQAANLEDIGFHTLRHSQGSWLTPTQPSPLPPIPTQTVSMSRGSAMRIPLSRFVATSTPTRRVWRRHPARSRPYDR